MPKGVCDPSPAPTNTLNLAVLDGLVSVTVESEWDGISVYPNCDGPVVSVRIRNLTDGSVSAMLPNARRASGRVYTAQPGLDMTITAPGTLKSFGYETIQDMGDLTIVEV